MRLGSSVQKWAPIYQKYINIPTTVGNNDGGWHAVRVGTNAYLQPYRLYGALPNRLDVQPISALETTTDGQTVPTGTTLDLSSVPGFASVPLNYPDGLGTNSDHTRLFVHKNGSDTIYEVDPSNGTATVAFTNVHTSLLYGQFIFDEATKQLFSGEYNLGMGRYQCTGETYPYVCGSTRDELISVSTEYPVGIDILNGSVFVSMYACAKDMMYISDTILTHPENRDFYQAAQKPTNIIFTAGLFTTDTQIYLGGYAPTFAVYSIS